MPRHVAIADDTNIERAIIAGDPDRIHYFASRLPGSELLSTKRGLVCYRAAIDGTPVLLAAHGIGAPSTAIVLQELIDTGVRKVIRVGSAGAFRRELGVGAIVIPTGVFARDGVSLQMVPAGFPAVPDLELTHGIKTDCDRKGIPATTGLILASDVYYHTPLTPDFDQYPKFGLEAVEMECSAVFVISHLRQVKAAAILVIDGSPLFWKDGIYDNRWETLKPSFDNAFDVACRAILA